MLYASGDGGWFGAAVDMFKAIGADGFCVVGLSSRTLMHRTLPGGRPLAVTDLAEDYRTILDYAATELHLPADRRVVLTGWSRGASLAVLTGGSRHAMPGLAGVIAIGLTEDENLAIAGDSDDDPAEAPAAPQRIEPGAVSAAGAGRPEAGRGDSVDRETPIWVQRAPASCSGRTPATAPVLRRDRKEPPLQRRRRRLCRRPQVSAGLGVGATDAPLGRASAFSAE